MEKSITKNKIIEELGRINNRPYYVLFDDQPESIQLDFVRNNGPMIQFIRNPSEVVQIEAVKNNSESIVYIDKPSEKVQLETILTNPDSIKFIHNPKFKIQLAAVKQDCTSIQFIKHPHESVQLASVRQSLHMIKHIRNPTQNVLNYVAFKLKLINENYIIPKTQLTNHVTIFRSAAFVSGRLLTMTKTNTNTRITVDFSEDKTTMFIKMTTSGLKLSKITTSFSGRSFSIVGLKKKFGDDIIGSYEYVNYSKEDNIITLKKIT